MDKNDPIIVKRVNEIKKCLMESCKDIIGRPLSKKDSEKIAEGLKNHYIDNGYRDVEVSVDPENNRNICVSFVMPRWFVEQLAEQRGVSIEEVKDVDVRKAGAVIRFVTDEITKQVAQEKNASREGEK